MKKLRGRPADPALVLLSAGSGATDAMAFLELGRIFTSAMTGNTALLGIAAGQADLPAASRSLSALAGFVAGAALAAALAGSGRRTRVVVRLLFLVEIAFLAAFALAAMRLDGPAEAPLLYGLILLSALGMGVQGGTARAVSVSGASTIVFTSGLIRIVAASTNALLGRPQAPDERANAWSEATAFAAYAASAVAAGLLLPKHLAWIAWLPVATAAGALAWCERALRETSRDDPSSCPASCGRRPPAGGRGSP